MAQVLLKPEDYSTRHKGLTDSSVDPSALNAPVLPGTSTPPTEYSDTSEDSDSEVACSGHEHLEKLQLDEVFKLNVDWVFENIFTDTPFFRVFVGSKKTFDLNLPPWEEEPDEDGNRVRNISYTLTLNNFIGPSTSPSTERQVCYKDSKAGRAYLIDCQTRNGGIPYADSFYVVLRYCLTRVSPSKCRVQVSSELKFCESVFFSGKIKRGVAEGLTDYFSNLSAHLRREAERQESHHTSEKKLRRRQKIPDSVPETTVQAPAESDEQPSSTPPTPERGQAGLAWLAWLVCLTVCLSIFVTYFYFV